MENENTGLRLLKKSHKGIFKMIFSRMGIVMPYHDNPLDREQVADRYMWTF